MDCYLLRPFYVSLFALYHLPRVLFGSFLELFHLKLMKAIKYFAAVLFLTVCTAFAANAQALTVKIKQEKTLPNAHEFILTWEGGEYKTTYYQVLDAEPMVEQQVFLFKQARISAIVKNPWTVQDLKVLFESKGFQVFEK